MVIITINMTAVSSKQHELLQVLYELQPIINQAKGCRYVSVSKLENDAKKITLHEEWTTSENALDYFRSKSFRVLLGAIKVLTKSSKLSASIGTQCADMKIGRVNSSSDIYDWIENALYNPGKTGIGTNRQQ